MFYEKIKTSELATAFILKAFLHRFIKLEYLNKYAARFNIWPCFSRKLSLSVSKTCCGTCVNLKVLERLKGPKACLPLSLMEVKSHQNQL